MTGRERRARKTDKAEVQLLEDRRDEDRQAVYDLSDQELEDCLRECWAEKAAYETSYRHETHTDELNVGPRPAETRYEEADCNQASTYPVPPGARRDEVFADVVHDGPKTVDRDPDRWSKGEVLDHLFQEELDEVMAERCGRQHSPGPVLEEEAE